MLHRVAITAVAAALAVAVVGAQEPPPLPASPAPEECTGVDRLTDAEVRRLAGTPGADGPSAAVVYGEATPPAGPRADGATAAAVAAAVRTYVACLNAGDWAAAYAVLSGDAVRARLVDPARAAGADPAAAGWPFLAATAQPLRPRGRIGLAAVRDVVALPDGSVRAVVEATTAPRGRIEVVAVVLVREGGRWRLATPFGPSLAAGSVLSAATPAATPAP